MTNQHKALPAGRRRTGFALLMVLIVVAMLALSTYTFCNLMITENEGAILAGQQLQARILVDSGVDHVRYFLEQDAITREGMGGVYDNPSLFQAQLVVPHDSPQRRGRFGIVAPRQDDLGVWTALRFGLQDESSRLNLNALDLASATSGVMDALSGASGDDGGGGDDTGGGAGGGDDSGAGAGGDDEGGNGDSGGSPTDGDDDADQPTDNSPRGMLMKLPGMTVEIADAILDWIDEDDEPREYGAEVDYYSAMVPSYSPANGKLQTIEELLLVRGVTPDLLFGRDVNRNGMLDQQEQALPLLAEYDNGDGSMDLGWSAYLTLYSQEKNVNSQGEPRINLNSEDLETLYDDLAAVVDPTWATFIIAYRQNGPFTGNVNENEVQPASQVELDLTQPGQTNLTQVLDLVGARVQIQVEGEEDPITMDSPFADNPAAMGAYLPQLMDLCTVTPDQTIPGRVNINRAPRLVLLAIPGMTEEIADMILSQRDLDGSEFNDELRHETWLLSRAIVTLDEMRELLPYVTAGGDVYRMQVVGYFDLSEISARAEVILDATTAYPRILSWKDISHLGRGYARELLGIDLIDNTINNTMAY